MKAAVLTAPYRIELVDRTAPRPAPDEVVLRILECGVCASEVDVWTGSARKELPVAIGHEAAGVVEAVGDAVTTVRPGDMVAAWLPGGGFAEQAIVAQHLCVPVDGDGDYPAVAEPLACVVNAVELAAPALGSDVVIVGAGYMGSLVQLVTALKGARSITVADVRADALLRAVNLGATRVVNSASESLADAVAEVTRGTGADVTYEVTGVGEGLELAGRVTRMGGKLCIVGYHQSGLRHIDLGAWNWNAFEIVNAHFRDIDTIMAGMRAGMRLVDAGALDVSPLVSHRFALSRITDAFEVATSKPDGFVKAVIEPDGSIQGHNGGLRPAPNH